MHVVHTVPHVGRQAAGPSYSVPALCRALGAGGVACTLVTQDGEALPPSPGFTHQTAATGGWPTRLAPSPDMEKHIAAAKPDVIHNHSMWLMANVYPGRVARRTGTPLVMAPRGCLSISALARSTWMKRAFWHLAQRITFDNAACFHATAEKEYDEIRAFGMTGPVAIVPNGIDLPEIAAPAGIGPRTVLFLGRVHPIKGLDLLLDVWRDLPVTLRGGWRLRIVGPNEDGHGDALAARAEAEGIREIDFAPALFGEEKTRAYAGADLYILPTKTENFGMTIAEALAAGTPVITTTGAPWQGLETHDCGWWVERTHAALSAALAEAMIAPRDRLAQMGANGRAWMANDYGWPALAARMAEVYAWLKRGKTGEVPDCVRLT